MSLSKSKDALTDYFQELLSSAQADDVDTTDSQVQAQARPASRTLDPHTKKDELNGRPSEPAHASLSKSTPTLAAPIPARSSGAFEPHAQPQPKVNTKAAVSNAPLETRDALREEQKQKLQALLSQQTLNQTTTEVKAEPTLQTETEDVIKQVVHDIEQGVELESVSTEEQTEVYDTFHSEVAHSVEWAENGKPYWAQEDFDALLFDVGGLTLAVPLVSLGQIVPLDKEALTPIFGQSDWFMGILPSNIGKLRVVNTALFVMPEKYNDNFPDIAEYVISIDGVPWALAVNKVNQPIRLNPGDIKWRSERSKRPWLAGTVKSAMCALLDIPKMAVLLNQTDKQLRTHSS